MNDTKLNGRKVYLPRGRDPLEDLNNLADCIAGSAADLFNDQEQSVIWIAAGKRVEVGPDVLREISKLYIVTKHPRKTAGGYEVEFRPHEPDEMTLRTLLMAKTREDGGLIWRLPKTPRVLSEHQQQEIGERLQRGEPAVRVAYAFGADVDMIKQLAR